MGPNVYPPASLLPPSTFQHPAETYYAAMHALALRILDLIAATLPHGPHIFDAFIAPTPAAPLRLLHYPPAQPTAKRQLGARAHTDFGAITLLLQDEHAGLEVQDPGSGDWAGVAPDPAAYVVNVGDMLQMWTGGEYRSSVHRVVNRGGDRYSVVFFFDGNLDCRLGRLGAEGGGEAVTVEEHMVERMRTSYGK